ncbi:hypothetical protein RHGRI_001633 [Rhododendron griersonianum]|uniref:Uncharacterized protein n=1 Tax=Rhododendron griersonianum TaxID=479676 RepID=A0AAV6LM27_9ERIC|nr:hypothetical protein RHGRI_001633 [Rhododendron griersonianum]
MLVDLYRFPTFTAESSSQAVFCKTSSCPDGCCSEVQQLPKAVQIMFYHSLKATMLLHFGGLIWSRVQ